MRSNPEVDTVADVNCTCFGCTYFDSVIMMTTRCINNNNFYCNIDKYWARSFFMGNRMGDQKASLFAANAVKSEYTLHTA